MPFGLSWPFRRKKAANQTQSSATSSESVSVQRATEAIAPAPIEPDVAGPDLGAELLSRFDALATPPTLGVDAGLNIAQTVPMAADFMQHLSLLTGLGNFVPPAPEASDFIASLSSLSSFTNLESTPILMGELPAPSGLTDELPPLGSLPNQLPGLMGVAPAVPAVTAAAISPTPLPAIQRIVEREATAAPFVLNAPIDLGGSIERTRLSMPGVSPDETPRSAAMATPIEPRAPIDFAAEAGRSRPIETPLPLNDFATSWPLISVPPAIESGPAAPTNEAVAPLDATNVGREFEALPLMDWSPVADSAAASSSNEVAASAGPAPSEPISISRYAADLPLNVPPEITRELPTLSGEGPIELPLAAAPTADPTAIISPIESFSPLVIPPLLDDTARPREVSQDLFTPPPIAAAPLSDAAESATSEAAEPALSISRYAEDLPLIDLNFGASAVEPEVEESTIDLMFAVSPASEGLPPLTPRSEQTMPLPSLPARDEAPRDRTQSPLITINRFAADRPLTVPPSQPRVPAVQRMSLFGGLGGLTQNLPMLGRLAEGASSIGGMAESAVGGLSESLPSPGGLTSQLPSLEGLAGNLPSLGGLAENMPSFGGLAGSIGGAMPQLPSLSGLGSAAMPLPPSIGEAIGGAGGAAQEALGQITSIGQAMPEMPSMPQLPNIDKLTDQVWRQIQHKLKVERERTRGLA